MKFKFSESEHDIATDVAAKILNLVSAKPNAFLLLATGHSPTLAYDAVTSKLNDDANSFSAVKIHKLDEWEGLDFKHEQSCDSYLQKHVLIPWGINAANYSGVSGTEKEADNECLKANSVLNDVQNPDLCILGIGLNGHIGFNEPADSLPAWTSVVDLAPTSMQHPMIEGISPIRRGITTGIAQILKSKKIIVIVTGNNKKDVLEKLINTVDISTQFPASLLLTHPDVEILHNIKVN